MTFRTAFLPLALLAAPLPGETDSLDLAVGGVGLSLGNSSRITGVRVNLVDHEVRRVTGLNLTLWKARRNPDALIRGAGIGLVGPYARRLDGIALGGLFAITEQDLNGIAVSGLGVDAGRDLQGIGVGLGGVVAVRHLRGIALAGVRAGARVDVTGAAISPGLAVAGGRAQGILAGGLAARARQDAEGALLAAGGAWTEGDGGASSSAVSVPGSVATCRGSSPGAGRRSGTRCERPGLRRLRSRGGTRPGGRRRGQPGGRRRRP